MILVAWLLLQNDPAALVEQLRSERLEERTQAERKLKELGKAAVPALEKAAKDADTELAGRAARLLQVLSLRERFTPNLLQAMPDLSERIAGDEHQWVKAFLATTETDAKGWSRMRGLRKEDVKALAPEALARAKNPQERSGTYLAISSWELRELAPQLVPRLKDEATVAAMAANALVMLGTPEIVPDLVRLLSDPDPMARRNATHVIRQLDPRVTDPSLAGLLEGRTGEVLAMAIDANARLDRKEALPAILKELDHPRDEVRQAAASAVSRLGGPEQVPQLLRLLRPKEDVLTQMRALEAVARLDRTAARQQAERLLGSADDNSRQAAFEAIPRLGLKECGEALMKLVPGEDGASAVSALAQLGDRQAIPEIRKLFDKGDDRGLAVSLLASLGSREDAPRFRDLLGSESTELRRAATFALAGLGDLEAIPGLEKLAKNPDRHLRTQALSSLARLRAPSAGTLLEAALLDPVPEVVQGAALELGRLGHTASIPALSKLLHESTPRGGRALYFMALIELGAVDELRALPDQSQRSVPIQGRPGCNALRSKDLWRKLNEARLSRDLEGPVLASLEAAAREAGLGIEFSVHPSPHHAFDRHQRVSSRGGFASPREALDALLWPDHTYILEKDRIRILSMRDALAFWDGWWASFRLSK